ncbi:MAG: hypothetical protein Q8Q91_01965 [Candidatus Daviesbacteria bacterium]|nr:hypothetical protein [Candidatus Daviesbacteria bacterium]
MVKILALLIVFSLVFISTCAAYAKESTGTATTRKGKVQEKIEVRKEAVATRAAALKDKLKNFRDQKKASAAARISENLNKINDNQTAQMLKHLDKMTSILNKLEARVTNADPAIETAKAKIASSEAAVKAQAENDYSLVLSSESKARVEAQALRQKLHTDLKAVRQTVIDAKQSVAAAIRAAREGAKNGTTR